MRGILDDISKAVFPNGSVEGDYSAPGGPGFDTEGTDMPQTDLAAPVENALSSVYHDIADPIGGAITDAENSFASGIETLILLGIGGFILYELAKGK